MNVSTTIANTEAVMNASKTLLGQIKVWSDNTPAMMQKLKADIENHSADIEKVSLSATRDLEAMIFSQSDALNDKRCVSTKLRHARDNVGKVLLANKSWDLQFVKATQSFVHALQHSAAAEPEALPWNPEVVTLLADNPVFKVAVDKANLKVDEVCFFGFKTKTALDLNQFFKAMKDNMVDKIARADQVMMKNPNWSGLMGKVSVGKADDSEQTVGTTTVKLKALGGDPWIFTYRKNAFRKGSSAYPLPGIPSFLVAFSDPLIVLCMPMAELLEKGICLTDYSSFISTKEGVGFVAQSCKMLRLNIGDAMFAPAGWLLHIVYYSARKEDSNWAHGVHLPLFEVQYVANCSSSVIQATRSYSEGYLGSKKGEANAQFAERLSAFNKFFDEVGKASSA